MLLQRQISRASHSPKTGVRWGKEPMTHTLVICTVHKFDSGTATHNVSLDDELLPKYFEEGEDTSVEMHKRKVEEVKTNWNNDPQLRIYTIAEESKTEEDTHSDFETFTTIIRLKDETTRSLSKIFNELSFE